VKVSFGLRNYERTCRMSEMADLKVSKIELGNLTS
jgi:hypothetical protein